MSAKMAVGRIADVEMSWISSHKVIDMRPKSGDAQLKYDWPPQKSANER